MWEFSLFAKVVWGCGSQLRLECGKIRTVRRKRWQEHGVQTGIGELTLCRCFLLLDDFPRSGACFAQAKWENTGSWAKQALMVPSLLTRSNAWNRKHSVYRLPEPRPTNVLSYVERVIIMLDKLPLAFLVVEPLGWPVQRCIRVTWGWRLEWAGRVGFSFFIPRRETLYSSGARHAEVDAVCLELQALPTLYSN